MTFGTPKRFTRVHVHQLGLEIAVVARGELVIVFLDGVLNTASTPLLVQTLDGLADQRFSGLWVNLAGITHIDASAIDALLAARARLSRRHREFLVRSPSSAVAHSFEMRADCAALVS